jgi:hypothetical protein
MSWFATPSAASNTTRARARREARRYETAENGSDAYGGQTDVNGGPWLLIFVWRTDNSFVSSLAVNAG